MMFIFDKKGHFKKNRKAFTLIEILVVIGILGILAAVVIIAINPTKQLCDAHDVERRSMIRELNNATIQYLISEWEEPSSEIPLGEENALPICRFGVSTDPTCVNLDLLVPDYLADLPVDEIMETNDNYTGYSIYRDAYQRIQINALYLGECELLYGYGS
ncbi:type II secretion system GspH family protein [Patescibacteria group bacterium]|nr:type II secretion system GspH family protein [Patescibacteria group bacterium]